VTGPRPGTLWWKYEDGPADGTGDDVGPAWIVRHDGSDEDVNGGDWITRSEAIQLASNGGYEFCQDGGWEPERPNRDDDLSQWTDATEINERLRSLGVSADELTVESNGGTRLLLIGSLVNDKIRPRSPSATGNPYGIAVHATSMPEPDALAAIERVIPGWR
jgi:hypothetical protein